MFFQHKIDSFALLNDLVWIGGNIEEFNEIEQHLNEILSSLEKYFLKSKDIEFVQRNNWIKNPFLINDKFKDLSITEYKEFVEMTTDSSLKALFDKISLTDFWYSCSIITNINL